MPRVVSAPSAGDVIVDLRTPEERSSFPLSERLSLDGVDVSVVAIPYYALPERCAGLASERSYLLYCDSGMMSRIQTAYLRTRGFNNVAVLDPGAMPARTASADR